MKADISEARGPEVTKVSPIIRYMIVRSRSLGVDGYVLAGAKYTSVRSLQASTLVSESADEVRLVSFMEYDPCFFDEDVGRVEPATNPFVPEL